MTSIDQGRTASIPVVSGAYNPLGLFRLVLALLVVLQHVVANNAPADLHDRLVPYEFGSIAVYVFFILSGFIIAEATRLNYVDRPVPFLVNRLLRIVPSYLVALAVTMLAVAVALRFVPVAIDSVPIRAADLLDPVVIAANLASIIPFAGLGSWDEGSPILIPIVWAIRVELLFYFVWFGAMVVALWLRVPFGRVLIALGLSSVAVSTILFDVLARTALENVPFFVAGIAAHRLVTGPRKPDAGMIAAGLLFAAGLALSLARIWDRSEMIGELEVYRAIGAQTVLFLSLLAAFWMLASVGLDPRGAVSVADRRLGERTYPIYLNHVVVLVLVGLLPVPPSAATMVVAVSLAIAVSLLVAVPTEPVIARLRDRVRGRRLA